jgi:SAM-dependent methyltransferase
MLAKLKYLFVKKIYADHNDARAVKVMLRKLLSNLPPDARGLNVGAGQTKLDPRIKNMEIEPGNGIDIVGSVERIPCEDEVFDLVITQEVLEHVKSPHIAVKEIHRVLKRNGIAYIQLPFIIGYHPCPQDYWRFTHEGLIELVQSADFEVKDLALSVGPAVGFYRIIVEFLAIVMSVIHSRLYKPAKLLFSIFFYPIKLLDPVLRRSSEARRIAGGYFVVCRKK